MTLALPFSQWLLSLHLLSAFALVGSLVLFWAVIVATYRVDTPGTTLSIGQVAGVGSKVVVAGAIGTLVFGIWLAIERAHIEVWSGWVLALVLGWFGLRRLGGGKDDFLAKVPVVSKMSGETLLKGTTVISIILLAGYVLAIWAMGGKPA